MDCYTVPKVVNYGVLYWASVCHSWCFILSQWMWIMVSFTVPVVMNNDVSCWVSGCELCCAILVNHGELYWAIGCESWFVMLCQCLWVMVSYVMPGGWIMVCYAEPVAVNHAVLYLFEWFVNHGVQCWASGCESWCVMLSQWLWIMLSYGQPVVVSHGELCWANGCESWCVMLRQWLWIMVCYAEPVVVKHGV